VRPVADEWFEFAGHGGDDGYSGHGRPADWRSWFPTLAAQGWGTQLSWHFLESSLGMAAMMATRVMGALLIGVRGFPPLLRKDGAPGLRGTL
jgi:hypothetical protein